MGGHSRNSIRFSYALSTWWLLVCTNCLVLASNVNQYEFKHANMELLPSSWHTAVDTFAEDLKEFQRVSEILNSDPKVSDLPSLKMAASNQKVNQGVFDKLGPALRSARTPEMMMTAIKNCIDTKAALMAAYFFYGQYRATKFDYEEIVKASVAAKEYADELENIKRDLSGLKVKADRLNDLIDEAFDKEDPKVDTQKIRNLCQFIDLRLGPLNRRIADLKKMVADDTVKNQNRQSSSFWRGVFFAALPTVVYASGIMFVILICVVLTQEIFSGNRSGGSSNNTDVNYINFFWVLVAALVFIGFVNWLAMMAGENFTNYKSVTQVLENLKAVTGGVEKAERQLKNVQLIVDTAKDFLARK